MQYNFLVNAVVKKHCHLRASLTISSKSYIIIILYSEACLGVGI